MTSTNKKRLSERKHIPKIEYASELSVAGVIELGQNVASNAGSAGKFVFNPNSKIKFHDIDDSIGLLFKHPCTMFIS